MDAVPSLPSLRCGSSSAAYCLFPPFNLGPATPAKTESGNACFPDAAGQKGYYSRGTSHSCEPRFASTYHRTQREPRLFQRSCVGRTESVRWTDYRMADREKWHPVDEPTLLRRGKPLQKSPVFYIVDSVHHA